MFSTFTLSVLPSESPGHSLKQEFNSSNKGRKTEVEKLLPIGKNKKVFF